MALKITNQLVHLPNEIAIERVESHDHSFELFIHKYHIAASQLIPLSLIDQLGLSERLFQTILSG